MHHFILCVCEQYLAVYMCSHGTSPLSLIHGSHLPSLCTPDLLLPRLFAPSLTPSIPCAASQAAETFPPSSLLVSGGPHPLLLYFLPLSYCFPPLFCSDLSTPFY